MVDLFQMFSPPVSGGQMKPGPGPSSSNPGIDPVMYNAYKQGKIIAAASFTQGSGHYPFLALESGCYPLIYVWSRFPDPA